MGAVALPHPARWAVSPSPPGSGAGLPGGPGGGSAGRPCARRSPGLPVLVFGSSQPLWWPPGQWAGGHFKSPSALSRSVGRRPPLARRPPCGGRRAPRQRRGLPGPFPPPPPSASASVVGLRGVAPRGGPGAARSRSLLARFCAPRSSLVPAPLSSHLCGSWGCLRPLSGR